MKKKLLFMIINMNIAGAEKALLNMLAEINSEEYNVTLLMLEEYGGFLEEVPHWINVKYLSEYADMKLLLKLGIHEQYHIFDCHLGKVGLINF